MGANMHVGLDAGTASAAAVPQSGSQHRQTCYAVCHLAVAVVVQWPQSRLCVLCGEQCGMASAALRVVPPKVFRYIRMSQCAGRTH